ncbi:hypothetical protein HPB00_11225 [Streptococcus suis]|nr:hypothetical protein [Streptococcus suis]
MNSKKWIISFDIERILELVITLLVIIGTNSIFSTSQDFNFPTSTLLMLSLGVNFIFVLKRFDLMKNDNKLFFFSMFWTLIMLIYSLAAPGNFKIFIRSFVIIFILLLFHFKKIFILRRPESFFKDYSTIIKILGIISLFFWIFASILKVMPSTGYQTIYWGREILVKSYFNIYFEWQNDLRLFNQVIYRNIGIFTEAPMLSLHLSIAYLFEFFVLGNKKLKTFFLYFALTLSTFSTTGILLLLLSYFSDVILKSIYLLFKKHIVNYVIVLIPIIVFVVFQISRNLLLEKLSTFSGSSRLEDFSIGFRAWMENPIFGEGFGNIEVRRSFMSAYRISRAESGFTSSLMAILSEGGLFLATAFIWPMLMWLVRSIKILNSSMFIFTTLIIFLVVTTTFEHTPLMICLLAFFYIWLIEEKSEKLSNKLFI